MSHKNTVLGLSEDGTIKYQLITEEYLEPTLKHLAESFFRHENIMAAIGFADDPEAVEEFKVLLKIVIERFGITVVAIDKISNAVAGTSVNRLKTKLSAEERLEQGSQIKSIFSRPGCLTLLNWARQVDELVDLFELCQVDCLMEIFFLSTSPDYRGKGIGKKLSEVSIELARKLSQGVNVKQSLDGSELDLEPVPKAVCATFSSFITQKIGKDLGFTIAAEKSLKGVVIDGVDISSRIGKHTTKVTTEYLKLN